MARFRRLRAFLVGVVVALFASSMAHAQSAGSVNVTPSSVRYARTTAAGVDTSAILEARVIGTAADGVKRYGVNVPVSADTLGKLAAGALRKATGYYTAYQLLKGLVEGAGWAIDELQQQVVDGPSIPQSTIPAGQEYIQWSYNGQTYGSATTGGMCAVIRKFYPICEPYPRDGNWQRFKVTEGGGTAMGVWTTSQQPVPDAGTGSTPSPVTPQQLGDLVKTSPEVVNAILIDPQTGAPIRTPELVDAMNALRRQLEAANGLGPGPDIVADPNYPTNPQPLETEWPGFCDWATVVCDFIKWMKEEPDVQDKELPEEELQIEPQEWASGMPSTGSCPAPVSFTVTLAGYSQTAEFSYQPLCDFLSMLRPVILAMGAVVAGWIIAGRGMARNA